MFGMISIFLNLPRLDLWPRMWSILEKVLCALEKKVKFIVLGWNVLYISIRSNWSITISSVQSLSCVGLFASPWTAARQSFSCPSPTPTDCFNSCPSISDANQTSHPLLSPSPQTSVFPASGSFPISQFFRSVGQSSIASASASVLPMNIQDWFPLGWTGWVSLLSKGLWRVFLNATVQNYQFFGAQLSLCCNSCINT